MEHHGGHAQRPGRAHTSTKDGHPALRKQARSARDLGGPTPAPDAEPQPGGGHARGTKPTHGFGAHR